MITAESFTAELKALLVRARNLAEMGKQLSIDTVDLLRRFQAAEGMNPELKRIGEEFERMIFDLTGTHHGH